ncbi:hypothetical protein L1887_39017 [Cichorium endivia]|nr:hypothetical protein L1887_39017 [Cichorium endivia]
MFSQSPSPSSFSSEAEDFLCSEGLVHTIIDINLRLLNILINCVSPFSSTNRRISTHPKILEIRSKDINFIGPFSSPKSASLFFYVFPIKTQINSGIHIASQF